MAWGNIEERRGAVKEALELYGTLDADAKRALSRRFGCSPSAIVADINVIETPLIEERAALRRAEIRASREAKIRDRAKRAAKEREDREQLLRAARMLRARGEERRSGLAGYVDHGRVMINEGILK